MLAIDQGMVGALLSTIFGTIGIAFAGLGIAGAIVFAVLWQRSKAAKSVATGYLRSANYGETMKVKGTKSSSAMRDGGPSRFSSS